MVKLWLEKVLNNLVTVLRVLACASCNVPNVSIHRLLAARVVFSMVSFRFVLLPLYLLAVLQTSSTGQTFVQMSLLKKSKSLPNFRFQISWCIVNSIGVVGYVVVLPLVVFPSDTLTLLSR